MKQNDTKFSSFLLFLIGVFSETKIYFFGCLAISELVIFFVAPLIFVRDFHILKRTGFMPFIWMTTGLICALFASGTYNHTPFFYSFGKFGLMYGFLAYFIVLSRLLRNNMKGIRWFLVGVFISSIIIIYAFNPTLDRSGTGYIVSGSANTDEIIEGQLFWFSRFKSFMSIFVCGCYLEMPLLVSLLTPFLFVVIVAMTTPSGRSAVLTMLMGAVLMIICGKNRKRMRWIGKYFVLLIIGGVTFIIAFKAAYSAAAKRGYLGEAALVKYEQQTRKGSGVVALVVAGRAKSFAGVPAALEHPIMGWGMHPEDTVGSYERFLASYGDEKDMADYFSNKEKVMRSGGRMKIPLHSLLIGGWVTYGIFGLIYYLWVLYLLIDHYRRFAAAIPQWFGYFAFAVPSYMWHVFFSPEGSRWGFGLLMACLFFARSVGSGKMWLPYDMEMQARRHEK